MARLQAAYEHHSEALLAYALRRTGSREDAEEIVSSSFATAWRRIDQLPSEPLTRTWLYRVAWRTLANQRRGDLRRRRLRDRLAELGTVSGADPTDQDGRVHEALARLRLKDQEVLRLVAWEELSHAEVATVLGCTANAVAIRLHRARAALRRELERQDEASLHPSTHQVGPDCMGNKGSSA